MEKERKRSAKDANASLTDSSGVSEQPKKQKTIQGISAASIVALKSELVKQQQYGNRSEKEKSKSILDRKNRGVADRDRIDRLHVKEPKNRLSESRSTLERKAELYDRLVSGKFTEDDEEAYEVDFLMKNRAPRLSGRREKKDEDDFLRIGGDMWSADMEQEVERRDWESRMEQERLEEEQADEKRRLISQIEKESKEKREKSEISMYERQAAENRKKERLKAEFLKKQLALKKAAAATKK